MPPGPPDKGLTRKQKKQQLRQQIHQALDEIFAEAIAEGLSSVRVKADDLCLAAGSTIAVAACCEVMVREMGRRDRIEAAPPKGLGEGLVIRYALPRRSGGRLPRSFFSRLMV